MNWELSTVPKYGVVLRFDGQLVAKLRRRVTDLVEFSPNVIQRWQRGGYVRTAYQRGILALPRHTQNNLLTLARPKRITHILSLPHIPKDVVAWLNCPLGSLP